MSTLDEVLEPAVSSCPVVFLDVGVVFLGGEVGGDGGYAVGKPVGMGDRNEVFQAVPQADRGLNIGQIELLRVVERAVVLPGSVVVKCSMVTGVQRIADAQGEVLGPFPAVRGILLCRVSPSGDAALTQPGHTGFCGTSDREE